MAMEQMVLKDHKDPKAPPDLRVLWAQWVPWDRRVKQDLKVL